jgi:hypothetical protein
MTPDYRNDSSGRSRITHDHGIPSAGKGASRDDSQQAKRATGNGAQERELNS